MPCELWCYAAITMSELLARSFSKDDLLTRQPKPTMESLAKMSDSHVARFIVKNENRMLALDPSRLSHRLPIRKFVKVLEMTPRQVQESFRIIAHVLSTQSSEHKGNLID
jgi:hypothetical protein